MNIEMSPKEYWKELNYYDGLLYLSLLSIDGKNEWRLMTNLELRRNNIPHDWQHVWLEGDEDQYPDAVLNMCWIIPVRTI